MQVLLKVGCEKVLLPNCKSIDSLLALLKDATGVKHESTRSGRDANGRYVHESALVFSRKAEVQVEVVSEEMVVSAERWQEIVKETEGKIDEEQTRKANERFRAVES